MEDKQTQQTPSCGGPACSKGFKTMCGGQALIEGIMMRGPRKQSVVVRRPDGELEVQVKELRPLKDRWPIVGWPLIRGCSASATPCTTG